MLSNKEKVVEGIDSTAGVKEKIFIIDDNEGVLDMLNMLLAEEGYDVVQACSGREAIEKVKDYNPDLIILDIVMPQMTGMQIKAYLNQDTLTERIPVIFVSGRDIVSDKSKGFDLGIDDYITKPFDPEELLIRVRASLNRRKFYEKISMTDALTGLYNMHYFNKQFSLFFNMAKRYHKVFSLCIIDINNFKQINDRYGHSAGDIILKNTAVLITKTFRVCDVVVRYGGDEFIALFPETDSEQVLRAVDRLQKIINNTVFIVGENKRDIQISLSVGIAAYNPGFKEQTQMFEYADAHMYNYKKKDKLVTETEAVE